MKKLNERIDRFCALHPNFGIPRIYLILVVANVAIFLLTSFSGAPGALLDFLGFSLGGLRQGRVWQLVTFVLIPGSFGVFSLLLNCYCTYWIGSALERQWGTAKLTVYYLCGMAVTLLGVIAVSLLSGWDVRLYGLSDVSYAMFIAFALFYPDAQIILFPIPIPIRSRYLAYFDVALFVYEIFVNVAGGAWAYAVIPLAALLNVFLFIWPELGSFLHLETRRSRQATHFRSTVASAQRQQRQAESGVRRCSVCGRTNLTNPELEFRYCSRCAGYHCFCEDHLFTHVHFTDENP